MPEVIDHDQLAKDRAAGKHDPILKAAARGYQSKLAKAKRAFDAGQTEMAKRLDEEAAGIARIWRDVCDLSQVEA